METFSNLESFVRSAELGSFSAAARRLALTPAAVSRNVAQLEASLGTRLFLRSTRRLTLTEAGERFLHNVSGGLDTIREAVADLTSNTAQPSGILRIAVATGFGLDYLLPLLPAFLQRCPRVVPDLDFDNRQVDLIADGFDVAIGGGIELTPGLIARELARAHIVAVAAPGYVDATFAGKIPKHPDELLGADGVVMRSAQSGRVRSFPLRGEKAKQEVMLELNARVIANDPEALTRSAVMGLGVALVATPHALPHLQNGALVRLLPGWYYDAGPISLYFAGQKFLPAKTRAFIDFLTDCFREQKLAQRFSVATK